MQNTSLKISWRNLTLIEPKSEAKILDGLNGSVEGGQFLSIMGPSGAGKSSLLSILTCRLRKGNTSLQIGGVISLNGQSYKLSAFSKMAAFVQQDDILYGTLTVAQTFRFQAKLKLWKLSQNQQEERCQEMIGKLNLQQCSNVLVGNSQFKKSISGGQKKRLAIGVQLLSNPQILVFDEPTSGLDSHNALIIVRLIARLAKQENKLIIATIHQPSTLIFQEMDKLYLLKKGTCIYNGPANRIVPYMQQLGVAVNYRMNPADFFMLQISQLKEQQNYKTPMNSQNFIQRYQLKKQDFADIPEDNRDVIEFDPQNTPIIPQFKALIQRSFYNFYRTPSNQLNKLVTAFFIPALLGILYNNVGNQAPANYDQDYIFKFTAYLFITQYFVFAMNVYDTSLVFPNEKQIVLKEAGGNLYSIFIYFIARMLTQILGCILPALVCGVILSFATGLDNSFEHFAVFNGVLVLMALQGYLFGLMFGVLCKDSQTAITMLVFVLIPIIIFGGLVVNINTIPIYIRWLQYISPLRHSFMIVFQDQLQSAKLIQLAGLNLPQAYGVGGNSYQALGELIGLLMLYLCGSLFLLFFLKKNA